MKHQYINFEYLHKDFNVEMATLSMVTGKCARGSEVKDQGFKSRSHLDFGKDFFGCYLFRTSSREANRNWSKAFEGSSIRSRNRFRISANVKRWKNHDYPWPGDIDPNFTGSYLNFLSHFKPLSEKPKPVTLPFEKPLVDLEQKITEVRFSF